MELLVTALAILSIFNLIMVFVVHKFTFRDLEALEQQIERLKRSIAERTAGYETYNHACKRWLEEEWFYEKFGIEKKEARTVLNSYYKQSGDVRWADGVEDLPYVVRHSTYPFPEYSLVNRSTWNKKAVQLAEKHINECV